MFDEPNFLIQMGYNGGKLGPDMMEKGFADGAILSPADFDRDRNQELATEFHDADGHVLFDPQFYIPRADRENLESYDYFGEHGGTDFDTADVGGNLTDLCEHLIELQDWLEVDAYLSPARTLDTFSSTKIDEWLDYTEAFIDAVDSEGREIPVLASLPLEGKPLNDKDQRDTLLNRITGVDPDGFYVSVEFDQSKRYPLSGASNIYSYLDLLNTLRKNRFEILVGHTHHVAHLFMGIGINAFASGHYNNLRAFDQRRWDPDDNQGGGRLVTKYYSDKLLNELRLDPDLDLMYQKSGFDMDKIRMSSPYDTPLFSSSDPPSTVGWNFRRGAWDHYLWACYQISRRYRGKSLTERYEAAMSKIEEAEELFGDVQNEFGMMAEPEGRIFDDWRTALSTMKSDL
ncbi:hypothetical protein [Halorubrum trueperi]|uniref:Uncharacterized protein n=1 Tax=Halorubrum trueperi TaxID=2004704 RepID=A0ABD5ULE7_9EURY